MRLSKLSELKDDYRTQLLNITRLMVRVRRDIEQFGSHDLSYDASYKACEIDTRILRISKQSMEIEKSVSAYRAYLSSANPLDQNIRAKVLSMITDLETLIEELYVLKNELLSLKPLRAERGASVLLDSENSSRSESPVPPPSDEEIITMEANNLDAELNKVISEFKRHARCCVSKMNVGDEEEQDDSVNAVVTQFVSKKIYKDVECKIEIANIELTREAVENARVALRDLKIHARVLLKFFPDINDYCESKISAIRNGARFGFCEVSRVSVAAAAETTAVVGLPTQ